MQGSTRAFFIRFSSLRRAAEARDHDVPQLIAVVRRAKATASHFADVAALLNR